VFGPGPSPALSSLSAKIITGDPTSRNCTVEQLRFRRFSVPADTWVQQAEIDAGKGAPEELTTDERNELSPSPREQAAGEMVKSCGSGV